MPDIFTEDEVASLNAYQDAGMFHPFTCGNSCGASLRATTAGWACPTEGCDYTQGWAHPFMKDWSWKASMDAMHRAIAELRQGKGDAEIDNTTQ